MEKSMTMIGAKGGEMTKAEKHYLWWLDRATGNRTMAGVAFFEEKYNEYRLKIDFLTAINDGPGGFYLRVIGAIEDRVLYRAEAVRKVGGKFAGRFPIGDGYSSPEAGGEVHIQLGPFERTLLLTLNGKTAAA